MSLLLIDNHDSFTYNLVDMLRGLQATLTVVNYDDFEPAMADSYSHIMLSPGADTPDVYPKNFEFLTAYHSTKKILGVCLGHQTIGQFFGARLYPLDGVRHGQQSEISIHTPSPLFDGLSRHLQVGLYHSWAIDELPPVLIATAHDSHGTLMAIRHRDLPIFGVQFHPESFLTTQGQVMLDNFLKV